MDAYQNLANAIIILAVKDYKVALARYKKFPNDKDNNEDKKEAVSTCM